MEAQLIKRFIIRFLIGIVPLIFLTKALLVKASSGNSGMSPNLERLIPFALLVGFGLFLFVEAGYELINRRYNYSLVNLCVLVTIASAFFGLMYYQHLQ